MLFGSYCGSLWRMLKWSSVQRLVDYELSTLLDLSRSSYIYERDPSWTAGADCTSWHCCAGQAKVPYNSETD